MHPNQSFEEVMCSAAMGTVTVLFGFSLVQKRKWSWIVPHGR